MKLRLRLRSNRYAKLISVYASTMGNNVETREAFYHKLHHAIRSIPKADKTILLGDFNARVGRCNDIWKNVIGRHGLLLLSLCAQHFIATEENPQRNMAASKIKAHDRPYDRQAKAPQ